MTKKHLLLLAGFIALLPASVIAQSRANITYGSAAAAGGGLFQGTDGNSADSITIGYFSGTANAGLTGWVALGAANTNFTTTTGFNNASLGSVNVTSAVGKEAWILITDAALVGLVRANDWASITGVAAPGAPEPLTYVFDAADSISTVTTLGNVVVTNNGGLNGSGISMAIAVPEPGTVALLFGFVALTWVAIRRRK